MGHNIYYYGKLKVTPEVPVELAYQIKEELDQGLLNTEEAWGDHTDDWHLVNSEIYWDCDSEKSYDGPIYIKALCQRLYPDYKVNGYIVAISDYHDESCVIYVTNSEVTTQNLFVLLEELNNAPIL